LALGYYLRMLSTVWFKPLSDRAASAHRTSRSMAIGMGILALTLVVIGIYPAPVYTIAEAAGSALMNFSQFAALLSGAP